MCGSEYIAMAAWNAFCQLILVGALLTGCTAAAEGGLSTGCPVTEEAVAFSGRLSLSTSILCSRFSVIGESLMIVLGEFAILASFLQTCGWGVNMRQSVSAFAGLGCGP